MSDHWNIVNFNDVHKFSNEVNMYRQGILDESEFVPYRLANGVYGQRQDDAYMVRIKLPAGTINIKQLNCISEMVEKHSAIDFANITTRQDIQLHFVPMKNISKVLLRLADVGLTTREACGNTVRNVTACPLAGVCEKEHVDIRPVLSETVAHFIRHPLTQFMPRKVKMSFSGCEADCAMGMIHDVGVVAVNNNGRIGYKVLVGGGLGHKPRKAIELENFVSKDKLTAVIESVITMHNRFSDRKKRAKSRIKFLVEKFGEDGFRDKYREVLKEVSRKLENTEKARFGFVQFCNVSSKSEISLSDEKQEQIEVNLSIGDITCSQVKLLSDVMKKYGLTKLRTTQSQNIILNDVANIISEKVKADLREAGFICGNVLLEKRTDIISCPGDWTCRLGITSSRRLAKKLEEAGMEGAGIRVHISACHNGCAQPQLADIGLHGEARRMFGKLIPYYQMYFGGDGKQQGDLALKGPEVPAARAEAAIKLVQRTFKSDCEEKESFFNWSRRKGLHFFTDLLKELVTVSVDDLPLLLRDVDSENEFKVLQLGGGECAGIAEETIASQLAEVIYEKEYRDIFVRQNDIVSAVDCAQNILRLIGKSVLFQQGHRVGNELFEILDKLSTDVKEYPSISRSFENFIVEAESLKESEDAKSFEIFSKNLDEWVSCFIGEGNKITLERHLLEREEKSDVVTDVLNEVLDLSSEVCPMHYVKARQALRGIRQGEVLRIKISTGEDERVVVNSLKSTGFEVAREEVPGDKKSILLYVRKRVVSKDLAGKSLKNAAVA